MRSPAVTIYIPTHNRATLLERAVRSVLGQTWADLEVIAVDDGSTDDTRAVLQRLAAQDARVRPFFHDRPAGACAARNTAIQAATGQWITGCDDDDYFEPQRVAEFVTAWQAMGRSGVQVSALCTPYWIEDAHGRHCLEPPDVIDLATIKTRNVVGNQVFALTDTLRAAAGFDVAMPAWQDFELWLRLVLAFGPMRRAGSCSYVQDQSHGLARISTAQRERLRAALEAMLAKHGHLYSRREKALLRLNYLCYEQVPLRPVDLLQGLLAGTFRAYAGMLLAKTQARWKADRPR